MRRGPAEWSATARLPQLRRIHGIIRKSRLGEFWLGVWKKYHGHAVVLEQSQIEWIIKAKTLGNKRNKDIARIQEVSVRRAQQLYAQHRRTGMIPIPKEAGRPRSEVSEFERRTILDISRMCSLRTAHGWEQLQELLFQESRRPDSFQVCFKSQRGDVRG